MQKQHTKMLIALNEIKLFNLINIACNHIFLLLITSPSVLIVSKSILNTSCHNFIHVIHLNIHRDMPDIDRKLDYKGRN